MDQFLHKKASKSFAAHPNGNDKEKKAEKKAAKRAERKAKRMVRWLGERLVVENSD